MTNKVLFEQLKTSDLVVDATYKGGAGNGLAGEVLSKLLGVGNAGGFRKHLTSDRKSLAFTVLFTEAFRGSPLTSA